MTTKTPHVLLAGATGYVGRAVARELVARGYGVTAMARDQEQTVPDCEMLNYEQLEAGPSEDTNTRVYDAVISCVASRSGAPQDAWRVDHDLNQRLLSFARNVGARQFILLSAICVQKPKLAFQFAKLAFEQALIDSGLTYSIIRPTAYFRSLSGQVERLRQGKPFLLFADGKQTACKPIARRDLAAFLVDCIDRPDRHNAILPIGGPGPAITARQQGELLFYAMQKPPAFRAVPPSMFVWFARVLTPLGWLLPTMAVKAEFARIAHYYATESMLWWNPETGEYDADATPSTGDITLSDHYAQLVRENTTDHDAGSHKLF
ncbi:MAG: NAD(P)H-binding protein [Pseudomonadota bacterium]